MITIEKVNQVTLELLQAMLRLVPQLTNSNPPPTPEELDALLRSEAFDAVHRPGGRHGGDRGHGDAGAVPRADRAARLHRGCGGG